MTNEDGRQLALIGGPNAGTAWDDSKLVEALTVLYESYYQGGDDFCGEQREYHLPRLQKAAFFFINLFPK
jgi:hypothetical protein